MSLVNCYIEIDKHSNLKYEFDKEKKQLLLDRVIPDPYRYPFAYGFIPNTLGKDGDDLDILVLTDQPIKRNSTIQGYIVGGLSMEDEKGMDEKIFVIPPSEYHPNMDLTALKPEDLERIIYFFTHYKSKEKNKWSKVHKLLTRKEATDLYVQCKIKL